MRRLARNDTEGRGVRLSVPEQEIVVPLARDSSDPVVADAAVRVPVIDDAGNRLVVNITRQALEDADQAVYTGADELMAAVDRHWTAVIRVADRKRARGQFDGPGEIGIYSVDLVPPLNQPTDVT